MKSLSQFAKDLRRLPTVVAQMVAAEAAPAITALAEKSFAESETPYGQKWPAGKKGQVVTLVKSGALKTHIRYVAIGTKLRVALGVRYARYQVGRRPVYPRAFGNLPDDYIQVLERVAVRIVRRELGR